MTKYLVLRELVTPRGEDPAYQLLASDVESHGPQQAIRKIANGRREDETTANDVEGTYIAVPVANWTEEPVSIERPPPRLILGREPSAQTVIEEPPAEPEPAA